MAILNILTTCLGNTIYTTMLVSRLVAFLFASCSMGSFSHILTIFLLVNLVDAGIKFKCSFGVVRPSNIHYWHSLCLLDRLWDAAFNSLDFSFSLMLFATMLSTVHLATTVTCFSMCFHMSRRLCTCILSLFMSSCQVRHSKLEKK